MREWENATFERNFTCSPNSYFLLFDSLFQIWCWIWVMDHFSTFVSWKYYINYLILSTEIKRVPAGPHCLGICPSPTGGHLLNYAQWPINIVDISSYNTLCGLICLYDMSYVVNDNHSQIKLAFSQISTMPRRDWKFERRSDNL